MSVYKYIFNIFNSDKSVLTVIDNASTSTGSGDDDDKPEAVIPRLLYIDGYRDEIPTAVHLHYVILSRQFQCTEHPPMSAGAT